MFQQQSATPKQRRFIFNLSMALTLIVVGLGLLLWQGWQVAKTKPVDPASYLAQQPGQIAPNFRLTSLSGKTVSLQDYRGQVVLLNLWATWCPPCKAEMPLLNTFYQTYRAEGLAVLAINHQEDEATVAAFIQQTGFEFTVLLDTQAEVSAIYGVPGLPATFIIDRNGIIQHVQLGEITEQQLEEVVKPLL